MNDRITLEIAVESVAAAKAAERGGADRIELCSSLSCGGLTPSAESMQQARSSVNKPVFAMIRPRAGNFCYAQEEFRAMKLAIELAREMKMDGVVLGILCEDHSADVERTKELVNLARPMKVTFHRAFDQCRDMMRALENVIQTGVDRILTSGGKPDAVAGAHSLRELAAAAGERIVIMPGGGITPENFGFLQQVTGAREFHSGLGRVLGYGSKDIRRFEEQVEKLASLKAKSFLKG
jgi:copper homeostasis protein